MREVISKVEAATSSRALTIVFVVLSLALIAVAVDFVLVAFGSANPTVLGTDLAAGFAILGLMTIVYYRMFVPHRVVIEQDEDLW